MSHNTFKKIAAAHDNVSAATYEKSPTHPYYIKENRLKIVHDSDKKETDIGRAIEIVEIRRDIDTQEVKLLLKYYYSGEVHTKEITRDLLTKNKILQLMAYGVDVNDDNHSHFLRFLIKQEESLKPGNVHSKLGFTFGKEKIIFRHHEAIGGDSVYNGNFAVEPVGTEKEWLSLVKKEVLGHPALELALVIGLAAPVASLIGKHTGMDVLVFHFYGNSSKGKTTATMLAVSPFGLPNPKDDGSLIKYWNATTNAVFAELADAHGIPIGFDESSMKTSEFGKIIYILASGKEKQRLDKNSKKKVSSTWSGVFLSNGEHALTAKSVKNTGIEMRISELGNVSWTESADHADTLKEGIFKNYGHAGVTFVTWLLDYGLENILAHWRKCKESFEAEISNPDHFASRISDKMAVLLATAEMSKDALGINFSIEEIKAILLQTISETSGKRNLGEKAYQYFVNKVLEHQGKFSFEGDTDPYDGFLPSLHWGKIVRNKKTKDWKEIWILPEKFKEIMREGDFEDAKVILSEWKTDGLLDCDSDRYTRGKRFVKGLETKAHVVKINSNVLTSP